MQRVSNLVADVNCAYCGAFDLKIIRMNLGMNTVTCAVICGGCRMGEGLRWNYGELGEIDPKPKPERVPKPTSDNPG